LPSTLISIGQGAFYNTRITSIQIPQGVSSIGSDAFSQCVSLTVVSLPGSLLSIGNGAFYNTSLAGVTFPAGITAIGNDAFGNCTSLVTVSLPNGLMTIGSGAFWNCRFSSITIPGTVAMIGKDAFGNNPVLLNVNLGNGIVGIGNGAFWGSNIRNITLPSSISSIGNDAFANSPNLSLVTFQGNAPSLGINVFSGSTNVSIRYIPGTSGWGVTYGDRSTTAQFQDSDLDGFSDQAEIEYNTNPFNSASIPANSASLAIVDEFRFPSQANAQYSIQASPDMLNWANVQTGIQGYGSVKAYQEYRGQSPKRFFRSLKN
jgi:hypothetical protein